MKKITELKHLLSENNDSQAKVKAFFKTPKGEKLLSGAADEIYDMVENAVALYDEATDIPNFKAFKDIIDSDDDILNDYQDHLNKLTKKAGLLLPGKVDTDANNDIISYVEAAVLVELKKRF